MSRRITIVLIIVAALMAAPPELLPQNGFRLGAGISGFQNAAADEKPGFCAASFITWKLSKQLYVQTELELSVRKAIITEPYLKGELEKSFITRNMSMPLLLLTPILGNHHTRISTFAGPAPGLNLGNHADFTYIYLEPEDTDKPIADFILPSIDFIAGVDIRRRVNEIGILLDWRISFGLLDQVDGKKGWSTRLTLGYSFNL